MFSANGELWKKLRRKSSPTLTTSKIKCTFGVIMKCVEQFKVEVRRLTEKNEPLHIKKLSTLLFMDLISKLFIVILFAIHFI